MGKENLDNGIKPDVIGLAVKGAAVRKIKFRVWNVNSETFVDKFESRIYSWGYIECDDGKEWIEPSEGSICIEQYTGLQDKNGKEIYEGDIVKFHDHPTGVEDGIGKVYWQDGKWMLTWSMIPLGDYGTAWTEVIGNIHENAGLLPL